jgi:hypothetical protein
VDYVYFETHGRFGERDSFSNLVSLVYANGMPMYKGGLRADLASDNPNTWIEIDTEQ